MDLSKDEETALLRKSIRLLEEAARAGEELIVIQKDQIAALESHNTELISLMNMFDTVKKG